MNVCDYEFLCWTRNEEELVDSQLATIDSELSFEVIKLTTELNSATNRLYSVNNTLKNVECLLTVDRLRKLSMNLEKRRDELASHISGITLLRKQYRDVMKLNGDPLQVKYCDI